MRDRLVMPLAIPMGAIVFIALVIFLLSRILLAVPKSVAPPIALAIALGILLTGAYFGTRPSPIPRWQIYAALGIPALALVVAGIIGAIVGPYGEAHAALPHGAAQITAKGNLNVFDKQQYTVSPHDGLITIRFRNQDPTAHNVAVYRQGPPAADPIFQGELVTGTTIDYTFPAPPSGTYFLQCDVHPQTMSATLIVQ